MLKFEIADIKSYSQEEINKIISCLPKWFLSRIDGHLPDDKIRSIIGYYLLIRLLKSSFNINALPQYILGPNGKPYLKDEPSIFFNISHSKDMVLCAIADCEIGVDIEQLRIYNDKVSNKYLQDFVIHNDTDYTKAWVKYESYIKLLGGKATDRVAINEVVHLEGQKHDYYYAIAWVDKKN